MIRGILAVLLLVFGLILSAALGLITFGLLAGEAAANTEGTATEAQLFHSAIAAPCALFVFVVGVLLSIWLLSKVCPRE